MSGTDDGDRPATTAELADLRTAVEALQRENEELKSARTDAERREAQANVSDAKADLDAVAASLGISRESLERATRDAKDAERKEELRPILRDLVAELRDEEAKAEADRLAAEEAEKGAKPPKGDKPKDDKPKGDPPDPPLTDDGPRAEHWSERKVGNLVK